MGLMPATSCVGTPELRESTRQVRARAGMPCSAYKDVIGLAGAQLLDAHRVRRRTVRRRARYLHRGAGFVCVNDGPALAAVLARVISI
jgi:hypothetical protein